MRRHLYFYTLVESSVARATATLRDRPELWLPPPATAAEGGWLVDLSAQGALPRPLSRHRVTVAVGDPVDQAGRLLRTVTWRSASAPGLFPVFDGDLDLKRLQGDGCQLSLMGTYRPPLSVAGDAADAVLGHHVAEACVRRFVLDLAQRLEAVTLTP